MPRDLRDIEPLEQPPEDDYPEPSLEEQHAMQDEADAMADFYRELDR